MKLFLILSLHFLLLPFLSEAKTKASIIDIYETKAEYEKLFLESEAIAEKYGEKSSKYKKIREKVDAKYDEFYDKTTVEYWKTIRTQAETKAYKATTQLEKASSDIEICNSSTNYYKSLYEQENASKNIAFIMSDELEADYTKLFDKTHYSEYNSKILHTQSKSDHKKTISCFKKIKKPDPLRVCLKKDQKKSQGKGTCVAQVYFDTCDDLIKCLKKRNWQKKKPESLRVLHKQCLFNYFVGFLDPYESAFDSVDNLYRDKDVKTKRKPSSNPTKN